MKATTREFFPGFQTHRLHTGEVDIHLVCGSQGPPLLLLHGYPQTHVIWRKIAPQLAERFSVVATDLRGYGGSEKPFGTDDHATYSKRVMAQDQVDVMRQLGHETFFVAGHDRGGRVALRLALDHPKKVRKLAVLDIAPTADMYRATDRAFATAYYHWFFLIQPYDLPERLIGGQAAYYLQKKLATLQASHGAVSQDVMAHYAAAFCNPDAIHAMCEDYRASATIDLNHDAADAATKVACPVLVLWGEHGVVGQLFDPSKIWAARADDVVPVPLPCGHFIPEERSEETLEAFLAFFA